VSAFYVSNVEEYLREDRKWGAFCGNVRELPLDPSSTFIRMVSIREPHGSSTGLTTELRPMLSETQACRPASAAR